MAFPGSGIGNGKTAPYHSQDMDVSLETPLQFLKGVGPKRAAALAAIDGVSSRAEDTRSSE